MSLSQTPYATYGSVVAVARFRTSIAILSTVLKFCDDSGCCPTFFAVAYEAFGILVGFRILLCDL